MRFRDNRWFAQASAGEVFVHRVYPEQRTDRVVSALRAGVPLFSLRGRAVLQVGNLRDVGRNLVFYIPWGLQAEVLEAPSESPYERWVCPYGVALKQPYGDFSSEALAWVRKVILKRKPFMKQGGVLLEDVRMLVARYFVGIAQVEEAPLINGRPCYQFTPEQTIGREEIERASQALAYSTYEFGNPLINRLSRL